MTLLLLMLMPYVAVLLAVTKASGIAVPTAILGIM